MNWYCLDCRTVGHLNIHGRCSKCGSDAVAIAVGLRWNGERGTRSYTEMEWFGWLRREVEAAHSK
jgi:hypothetical protein